MHSKERITMLLETFSLVRSFETDLQQMQITLTDREFGSNIKYVVY